MRPFSISEHCAQLIDQYPSSDMLLSVAQAMNRDERRRFIRLWLTEGIPFAFRDAPMMYETVRSWLASQFETHPKLITIIGSARIGYSLAPRPQYGRPFGVNSDLDLVVVSENIFSSLSDTFYKWKADVAVGSVQARNETERTFWEDNLSRLPKNISKGFVDAHKIPYWSRYPLAQNVANTMWMLKEILAATPIAPKIRKATVRAYRDWEALLEQMEINFFYILKSL